MLKKLINIHSPLDNRTKEFECYAPGSVALSICSSNSRKIRQMLENSFIHSVNLKYNYNQVTYDISAVIKKHDHENNYEDFEYVYTDINIDKLVVDSVTNVLHDDLSVAMPGLKKIKVQRLTFEDVIRELNLPEPLMTVSNTMYDDLLVAISKTEDNRRYILDVGTRIEMQGSSAHIGRSKVTSIEIYKNKILTYGAHSANDVIYMYDVDSKYKHYKNAKDIYLLRIE